MKIQLSLLSVCLLVLTKFGLAVPITVEVVDEKGAPIMGALVLVRPDTIFVPGEKAPAQTTGADGLAVFDLQSSKIQPDFYGRSVVFKAGYGIGGGDLKATKLRVALLTSKSRSGRVTDFKGAPIANANVELTYLRDAGADPLGGDSVVLDDGIKAQLSAQTRATTDKNGVWQLKDLPVNSEFGVTIKASNFADVARQLRAGSGEIETKLAPEARVNGQLVAPDGKPLAGVTVRVVPKERFERQGGETVTDAQGKFAVRGLSAASFDVYFKIKNQPFLAAKIDDFGARVGDNVLPIVKAQTGVVVRGKVSTSEGEPVSTTVSANEGQQRAETDKEGDYELRVLPGENVFALDLYNSKYSNARDKQTLQITEGDAPTLDWTLQIAPLLRGIITDEKGAPIKAKLLLTREFGSDIIEIQSDETGKFEVPAPFEGEATFGDSMWDKAKWDVVGRQTVKLPFRGELKLTVKPTVRRVFQTRVVDENGAPVVGAQFDANVWEGQSGRGEKIFSDENGVLRIDNITPRESITNPTIAKNGYQLRGELKVIDNGGDITTAPIVMARSAATARGNVINSAGQNAARARVAAAGAETIADENGAFALENLPAGELLVSAISADEQSYGAAKTPLQQPIQLQNRS